MSTTNPTHPTHRTAIVRGVRPLLIKTIIEEVCAEMRIWPNDLCPPGRMSSVVISRAVITALAREYTLLSHQQIADAMGIPNHTTVLSAHRRLKRELEREGSVRNPELKHYTLAYAACSVRVAKLAVSQS